MRTPINFRLSRVALCVALALGAVPALAQNTTSAVAGKVTALDGKAVGNAKVVIRHVESGSISNVTTDSEGRYSARGLRVGGPYTITVTKDGVTESRDGVFLVLAETNSVDLQLPRRETIVVTGTGLSTDKFSTTAMGSQTNLGKQEVDSLPSIQRSLQDLARIDPRVAQTDKERGEISVGGQNTRFNKVTIDGVNISDTFGLEANTLPTIKQPVSMDAIQSVQVNVSNYDVTQTGYTGGNINAVTKSGTNDFHGSVTYVYRDDSMAGDRYNRTNGTYTPPPKFEETLKGITFSGPILKDKLFFFLGYEELASTRNAPDFGPIGSSNGGIVGISQAAITGVQNLARTQYGIELGDVGATGAELTVKDYLAKLDWNINAQHRANLRYTKTEQSEPIFQNFSGTQVALSTNTWNQVKEIETLVGQWFADWSPTFTTELKVSNRDYHSEPISPTTLPEMRFNYTGALPPGAPTGTNSGTRTLYSGTERSRHFNILDTKTDDIYFGANWTLGAHEVKGLFDWSDNKIYNAFLQDTKGQYTFSCVNSAANYVYSFGSINCATATSAQVEAAVLENYQRGRPSTYLVQVPLNAGGSLNDGVAQFKVQNQGFAIQDTWTVNNNLTVQFGVRVDTPLMPDKPLANTAAAAPTVPGSVNGATVVRNSGGFGLDNTNTIDGETLVQPRVGFNYTFDTPRPMQLRGGVGLFQGAAATVWISNIYSNTGVATRVVGCGGAFAACSGAGGIFSPDSGNQPTSFPGAAPAANVDYLQDGLGQPSVWKANLAFEHELPWFGLVAGLEYLYTKTNTGLYYQHLNLGGPTRTGSDGRQLFYTPTAYLPACWSSTGTRITTGAVCSIDNRNRALSNPGYNNVLMATETSQGKGQLITASLAGQFWKNWNWSAAYTYTEQTEVNGLTSSVSNSNWQARASFNPNGDEESNSSYLTKNRFNATLVFERAFWGKYKTRIGGFWESRSGKPYSWVYANDMNGDGILSNDLMFIPREFGSGEVLFLNDTAANGRPQETRFWEIVNGNYGLQKYTGSVTERNSSFSPWAHNLDVRFSQELPGFWNTHKSVIALDILNFGNLLNKKWGHIDEIAFAGQGGTPRSFVNFVGIDPASGKYIYSVRDNPDDYVTRQARGESQWALQLTFRYEF